MSPTTIRRSREPGLPRAAALRAPAMGAQSRTSLANSAPGRPPPRRHISDSYIVREPHPDGLTGRGFGSPAGVYGQLFSLARAGRLTGGLLRCRVGLPPYRLAA